MNGVNAHDVTVTPAQNLPALLALDYGVFVECAYLTILNRPADSEALAHYVQRLRAGHSKLAILSALYSSEEARAGNVQIPWMRGAILRYKLTRLPLVRIAFNMADNRDFRLEYEHRLHVLESQVAQLASQSSRLAAELAELTGAVRHFIPPTEASVQPLAEKDELENQLSDKSVVAKRVYRTLSDAIMDDRGDVTQSR